MGNNSSLTIEETNKLQNETKCLFAEKRIVFLTSFLVSVRNIKRIHNRFSRLDRNEKGFVSPQDFAALPEVNKSNLSKNNITLVSKCLANRIAETLATKDKKQIDFSKFIKVY